MASSFGDHLGYNDLKIEGSMYQSSVDVFEVAKPNFSIILFKITLQFHQKLIMFIDHSVFSDLSPSDGG